MSDETQEAKEAAALRKLLNHPEVGLEAKRLYKKITPDARFPDLEIEDRLAAQNKEFQEKLEKQEQERLADRTADNQRRNHEFVRSEGLDPTAIEKVMTEERIASYETAVKFVKAQNALTAPTPGTTTPIQMYDKASDWRKNPVATAKAEAFKAIDELRSRRQV